MKEQVTIMDIFFVFLSNWWKVLIASVLTAVLALTYTIFCIDKTYVSRGSVYVNNNNAQIQNEQYMNLADIATSQQLAFTFIEILTSDTFMTRVQEKSKLPYTPGQIKAMVTMAPLNETEIVEVQAISYSPEHSQKIVDTILDNALDEVHRVIGGGSVKVIDEATYPLVPASPSKTRNTILGFLFGAIMSVGVLFLIKMFDNRIVADVDLMEVRELPLLGIIPDGEFVRAEVKKNVHK
ncbi:MAG: hypothetical protein II997_04720 [Clostridia bacterium]|nr:hypothetical protein [Clostridia bacterium]